MLFVNQKESIATQKKIVIVNRINSFMNQVLQSFFAYQDLHFSLHNILKILKSGVLNILNCILPNKIKTKLDNWSFEAKKLSCSHFITEINQNYTWTILGRKTAWNSGNCWHEFVYWCHLEGRVQSQTNAGVHLSLTPSWTTIINWEPGPSRD